MTGLAISEHDLTTLSSRYSTVRTTTELLAEPLSPEDQTIQSMPDVSPTKWHRAHTSWFFETFILEPSLPGYTAFDPDYAYLFNSYYEALGARHPRPSRGLLSRPRASEISVYRASVDEAVHTLIDRGVGDALTGLVELGLHHEQQHQELLLMDIKHVLSQNTPEPAYRETDRPSEQPPVQPSRTFEHGGGVCEIGSDGKGFCFDNELPRHVTYLEPFSIDTAPVTCGDWIRFIEDDGYKRADLWLSDGWSECVSQGWEAPLYWSRPEDSWRYFTLGGAHEVAESEPVCHVSYYEADAFARWAGARLPTEAEWEVVASGEDPAVGNFLDLSALHPRQVGERSPLFGDIWQWTSSSYSAYPGFHPANGAVGEYNGKFMVNQYVLRAEAAA